MKLCPVLLDFEQKLFLQAGNISTECKLSCRFHKKSIFKCLSAIIKCADFFTTYEKIYIPVHKAIH